MTKQNEHEYEYEHEHEYGYKYEPKWMEYLFPDERRTVWSLNGEIGRLANDLAALRRERAKLRNRAEGRIRSAGDAGVRRK